MRQAWTTQRIANRLPPWSDAARLPFSVTQQFLNPIAKSIDDLYAYVSSESSNTRIATANLDLLDVTYRVSLPPDFTFSIDENNLMNPRFYAPRVEATIGTTGGTLPVPITVTVNPAANNTITSFWYDSLPTRLVDEEETVEVEPILAVTTIGDLPITSFGEIKHPNKLAIIVSDCFNFIDASRIEPNSFIIIEGITERGLEETEYLILPYNGIFLTSKTWQTLTRVDCYGLTSTGQISIEPFMFNVSRETDKYQLYVDQFAEKIVYHRLGSRVLDGSGPAYSTHQQIVMVANRLDQLAAGENDLQVAREMELLYENSNLLLNDIAVQPFTGRLFAIDDNYLYIFSPFSEFPDCRDLESKTSAPQMVVESDYCDYIRGETVYLRPYWRKPVKPILWTRWSVKQPDETFNYFRLNSMPTASAEQSKIANQSYNTLVFGPFEDAEGMKVSKQEISYNLTQRGTYLFMLETYYADKTKETDIFPIQVHSKEALARIALPDSLIGSTGIAFDADQRLWLKKSEYAGDIAYQVRLATDNMLIDFEDKVIYFHEPYISVEIFP